MNPLKDLLVSIDGGGTKTIVQLSTPDGQIIGKSRGGPSNIATNAEEGWHSIMTTLQELLKRADLQLTEVRLFGGAGLAGAEVQTAYDHFMEISHDFVILIVKTDAYMSCLGAHQGKDGGIVAVGTGSVALAIKHHKIRKLSGWGFPQDDQGGGAWIGLNLISDMLQRRDGRSSHSSLSNRLYEYLKQQGIDPMVWAVGATPSQFASLVPWLLQVAKEGNAEANQLLDQAASIISLLAQSLLKGEFEELPLCLLGGLADILLPRLNPNIQERIVPSKGESLDGAFHIALQAYKHYKS